MQGPEDRILLNPCSAKGKQGRICLYLEASRLALDNFWEPCIWYWVSNPVWALNLYLVSWPLYIGLKIVESIEKYDKTNVSNLRCREIELLLSDDQK